MGIHFNADFHKAQEWVLLAFSVMNDPDDA
jgi:hypothetical protein